MLEITWRFLILGVILIWISIVGRSGVKKRQQRKHFLFFQVSKVSWVNWIEIVRKAPYDQLKAFVMLNAVCWFKRIHVAGYLSDIYILCRRFFLSYQFIFLIKNPWAFDGKGNLFSKIRNRGEKCLFLKWCFNRKNISIAINYFLIASIPLPAPYPHSESHH